MYVVYFFIGLVLTWLLLSKTLSLLKDYGESILHKRCLSNVTEKSNKLDLVSTCEHLNTKLFNESTRIIKEDAEATFDISTFDVDEFTSKVDPDVWQLYSYNAYI